MTEPLSFTKFFAVWLPTLAVAAVVPSAQTPLGDRFLIDLHGLPIPVVTCILGLVGIIAARPFTVRAEAELGWPLRSLVTFIMIVLVQLWIIENRPGWLFAFVVAIGLGFSGFSLLEMFGQQVKAWVQRALGKATDTDLPPANTEGPDGP